MSQSTAPQLALVPLPLSSEEKVPRGTSKALPPILALVEDASLAPVATRPRDKNAGWVYVDSLAPGESQRRMTSALNTVVKMLAGEDATVDTFPWGNLRFSHLSKLRSALAASKYAVNTSNTMISAVKGALLCAWKLEQIDERDYNRAIDIKNVKGSKDAATGRMLEDWEIAALFKSCQRDPSVRGKRDTAILATGVWSGLRRSELSDLDYVHYEPRKGKLVVASGKGNKERLTFIGPDPRKAMADWLLIRGTEPGPLFLPTKQGRAQKDGSQPNAAPVMRRMCDQNIAVILAKRAGQAGLAHVTAHDLRRTFASIALGNGVDINVLSKMMGHENVATTSKYDRRGDEAKFEAAQVIGFKRQPRQKTLKF